jgi:2-polyprenyl-3-methyl-5-hydroxy-6-metoxy-1,4-benzoquinol methylase
MDREVEKQLSLQVDLSLQRHRDFMIAHGLECCGNVVDIGTGSGRFLASIASEHPTISFHGLDDKVHMLGAAATFDLPNIDWTLADASDVRAAELLAAADGVLMRNLILHLPDTARSLQAILQAIRPGTRLWIFDVDLDHCSCAPSSGAFQQFLDMVRRFCEETGVAIRTEALLPAILDANRFRVDRIVVEPFNNSHIEPARFAEYLLREASLYHYALYGTPGTRELSGLRELLFSSTGDLPPFVQYGMVMLAAQRQPS